ncbi:(2Fe-2S)-binding protein [Methyloligella solikamskensis]|uniref:Bacterioferritin-associated ferredoxin n=1 Tax=Methyloligella solikamskensis TaxID=1177756 RepID=A0ABW3J858_9HYPH
MIVCSCSMISSQDIEDAVQALRTADPLVVLTPGLIYKYLGKRPSCGNCLPLITKLMVAYDDEDPSAQTSLAVRLGTGRPRGRSY